MFTVIFENNHFIIIDKQPGIGFHNDNQESGIFTQLKEHLRIDLLYPVHRLDKATSGLLIFAKDKETAAELGKLFETKQIDKFYLAISAKRPAKKQGTIKGDMSRSRRGSWKLNMSFKSPAITQFFSYPIQSGVRLYLIRPITGKTHQIRVALKSIGAPICGDPIYSSDSKKYDRTYLHAFALHFSLKGKKYDFKCIPTYGVLFLGAEFHQALSNLPDLMTIKWPRV
ncbi:MAG: TIGR01621 family pseudouridine synthase [Gammaproteobacteria bacterium]|nr:MAG: TIGR01621 family pseudouridine synthase [Gammaproteobacteria bacterium]